MYLKRSSLRFTVKLYSICDTSFDNVYLSALVRPGRFDMQVTVPRPDVKGRTEILEWYLKKIKVDSGKND